MCSGPASRQIVSVAACRQLHSAVLADWGHWAMTEANHLSPKFTPYPVSDPEPSRQLGQTVLLIGTAPSQRALSAPSAVFSGPTRLGSATDQASRV